MSLKNLNATNRTHKFLFNQLKDKKTFKIYSQFEKNLKLTNDFIVAVSGGPDSLALCVLTKIYSIKKTLNVKYFLVNHKLRKDSSKEAKFVKNLLKKISIKLNILSWNGKKPKSNIQSVARVKRYSLLTKEAKKLKVKNILLGHHKDDVYENFIIRLIRGSGLNGMASFDIISINQNVNLLRPLLDISKIDLTHITNNVFKTYLEDPSNVDEKFQRSRIRNLIKYLEIEGLDKDKLNLTIKNLKFANESIKFFVSKNLKENSIFLKKTKKIILNDEFFNQPDEIVFRSFAEVIKIIGKKYYFVRGKKIVKVIKNINKVSYSKITLGNCLIKKLNKTVIVTKEQ